MNNKLRIAWHNGMTIDKLHFEQQERFLEELVHVKTTHSLCNFYGIFEVQISDEMLNLGKISVLRIKGIAKDGSIFDAPNNDLLPQAMELQTNISSPIVVLKIPMHSDSIPDISLENVFPHSKYITTNVAVASKIHDILNQSTQTPERGQEQFYSQQETSLALGSLRLTLGLLGDGSPNELEIPIAKIKNIHSNRKIELDDKFIPTLIDVRYNIFLRSFMEKMLFSIKQHKDTLSQIFQNINQTKNTLDFSTYLSLNVLKKYDIVFSYLLHKDKLHPEFLYEKLMEFQADLLGLSHNFKNEVQFIAYNHDDLTSVFMPLSHQLEILFANVVSPKYIMANIVENGNGFFDCIFENASIVQDSEIFLAISSSLPISTLLEAFTQHSKIHTQSMIKSIVTSQLKGLNLEPMPSIPSALPHLSGYVYFRLDKSDPIFSYFKNQHIISLYITNTITNPDIKLWALLA